MASIWCFMLATDSLSVWWSDEIVDVVFMCWGFGKITENVIFSSAFSGFQISSAPANRKNKIRWQSE